jgi:hypothetical protein
MVYGTKDYIPDMAVLQIARLSHHHHADKLDADSSLERRHDDIVGGVAIRQFRNGVED